MVDLYDKSGQDIFIVREGSTYGKAYDPESLGITVWTKLPANYVHWRKLDYISDAFDPILPIIEKIKIFDIGDSKHASAIVNGNIEPVEFSIDMEAQGLEFLMFAIGAPAFSSHTASQVMTQTITCPAITSITDLSYFIIDVVLDDDSIDHYLFWFDQDDGGTAPTSPTGIADANRFELEVDLAADADAVAVIVAAIINGTTDLSATSSGAVVTITHDNDGACMPARQGDANGSTGCIFAVTQWGSTTYTVTEALTTVLPSFTLHLEQRNATAAENIVWDLFGCVVESIEVNVAFSDKIVKYNVSIKCPYAVEGNTSTNPPVKKLIPTLSSMSALQESASNYIIQEGTTDRTPSTVEKVTLTISNNINFQSDISKQYMVKAIAGKRDVKLNIVGATHEKELFNYWQEKYQLSGTDYIPNSASGKLNTEFKLQDDATYNYLQISIYNWLLKEHNFNFVNVDDAVKMVDMTFEDGSADSNGRILDSTTFVSYVDRTLIVV